MVSSETLDEARKRAVRAWIEEGASLAEVQKRLREEFGLSMTYMDVRLLAIELGARVRDKPGPAPAKPAREDRDGPRGRETAAEEEDSPALPEEDYLEEPPAGGGKVSVSLDRVVQAGALVSGTVTFSDGVTANWMLDRMGRLAITAPRGREGYRPPEADLRAFQLELQRQLSAHGY